MIVIIYGSEPFDSAMPTPPPADLPAASEDKNRRSEGDRRAEDRRRSAKGLFEVRARRDRIVEDRRQLKRRFESRFFRLAFWRRGGAS